MGIMKSRLRLNKLIKHEHEIRKLIAVTRHANNIKTRPWRISREIFFTCSWLSASVQECMHMYSLTLSPAPHYLQLSIFWSFGLTTVFIFRRLSSSLEANPDTIEKNITKSWWSSLMTKPFSIWWCIKFWHCNLFLTYHLPTRVFGFELRFLLLWCTCSHHTTTVHVIEASRVFLIYNINLDVSNVFIYIHLWSFEYESKICLSEVEYIRYRL